MRPDNMKKSIAPERTCDNMSVSPPSWLLGNSWMSTRPLDSARIASAASFMRMLVGWVTGKLLANLSLNSAFCAQAWLTSGQAQAPAAALRSWRRGCWFGFMVTRMLADSVHPAMRTNPLVTGLLGAGQVSQSAQAVAGRQGLS